MATLNVQEYGAKGDGATDDTQAIQNALDDASDGDTVLFPETSDSYLLSSQAGGNEFLVVPHGPDNLTIKGETAALDAQTLQVEPGCYDTTTNNFVMRLFASSQVNGLTIQNLTIDGARPAGDGPASSGGESALQGFNVDDTGPETGHSIEFVDCYVRACSMAAWRLNVAGVTLTRCTAVGNGRHGFNPNHRNGLVSGTSLKSVDNDGCGIDHRGGEGVYEDIYTENNRSGNKFKHHITGLEVRNHTSVSDRNMAWRANFSSSGNDPLVVMRDVYAESPQGGGIDLTDPLRFDLDRIEVRDCQTSGAQGGIQVYDGGTPATSGQGELIVTGTSAGHTNGYGVFVNDTTWDIDTLRHANNASGPENGNVDCSPVNENPPKNAFDTPGPDEVGAFTDTAQSTDEPEETAETDFSEYSSGQVPNDWTPQWASADADWTVVPDNPVLGEKALQFDSATSDRHALSWDAVGTASDVEMLGIVEVDDLSQNVTAGGRVHLRSGGSLGSEDSYFFSVMSGSFGLFKYVNGGSERLASWGDPAANTSYFVRFRVNGTDLRARVWGTNESEPEAWDVSVTDTDLRSGWVGVGSYSEFVDTWAAVSVGVGGASAPMPDLSTTSSPAVLVSETGSIQSTGGSLNTGGL